jgi:transcriptional regulator with XRE-family HTH domain
MLPVYSGGELFFLGGARGMGTFLSARSPLLFKRLFQIGKPENGFFLAFIAVSDYHGYKPKMGVCCVNTLFAETLRKLRMKKGLSQIQLGKQLFVNHSTIARWESGSRLPDTATIPRLAECLGVDANTLFQLAAQSDESPNVIMVDDSKVILTEGLAVLEEVLPDAEIKGFIWPQEAIDYARANRVALAVLDIELGNSSGLALCRTLLEINPRTNVLFLTAYPDYSLDAWGTEACGFMLKPITAEGVRRQLQKLRYPFLTGGMDA